jgi:hypothetical protein
MNGSLETTAIEDQDHLVEEDELNARMRAARNAFACTRNHCAYPGLAKLLTWINDDGPRRRLVWRDDVADTTDLNQIPNAHLSLMIHIDEQDCFLAAHGGWRGPSTEAPTFADISLSFAGGPPPVTYLLDDFLEAMSNIDDIIRLAPDFPPSYKGLVVKDTGEKRIVFHHTPFLVRASRIGLIFATDGAIFRST